jgi:predicted transcriptional regulator
MNQNIDNFGIVPVSPDFSEIPAWHAAFQTRLFDEKRRGLLSHLRCVSGIPQIFCELNQETLYRLVYSEMKILQSTKNGEFRGVFYGLDGKRGISHHARFQAVGPNIVKAASAIGSQILLVSIAMQLNRIEKQLDNLAMEFHRDRIGEIHSGIRQYELAIEFQHKRQRDAAIHHGIQTLHTGLSKSMFELRSRIVDLPEPTNDFWSNWGSSKTRTAGAKMGVALETFQTIVRGVGVLSQCYAAIDEPQAGSRALRGYFDEISRCDLLQAARSARLVRIENDAIHPETIWKTFPDLSRRCYDVLNRMDKSSEFHRENDLAIDFYRHELIGG